jgi:hypothetical protein
LADTGTPDPYTADSAWYDNYRSLERFLVARAQQFWNISDYHAEMFAQEVLDQPSILGMISGNLPKKRLSRTLLVSRLKQVYFRHGHTHIQEGYIMDESDTKANDNTADTAINNLLFNELGEVILSLSEEEQLIFTWRYELGYSFQEIGLICGFSDETARRKYHQVANLLRKHLKPDV